MSRKRAEEFLDDLKNACTDKHIAPFWLDDAFRFVAQDEEGKVDFLLLCQKAFSELQSNFFLRLTESAKDELFQLQQEDAAVRDFGRQMSRKELAQARKTLKEMGSLKQIDQSLTLQPGTLAAAPRDVLVLIFSTNLTLTEIFNCSRVCRRFFLAANVLLSRAKPPFLALLEPSDPHPAPVILSSSFLSRTGETMFISDQLERSFLASVQEKIGPHLQSYVWYEMTKGLLVGVCVTSFGVGMGIILVSLSEKRLLDKRSYDGIHFNGTWFCHDSVDGSPFLFQIDTPVSALEIHVKDGISLDLRAVAIAELPVKTWYCCTKSSAGPLMMLTSQESRL